MKRPLLLTGAIFLPLVIGAISPAAVERARLLSTDLTAPLFKLQDRTFRFLKESTVYFLEIPRLKRENSNLRGTVESLKREFVEIEELRQEKKRLEKLLNLKTTVAPASIAARVIARDSSPWVQYIVIDRGTRDGVRENTALLANGGLVGKVVSASRSASRAILLIDSESRVSVLDQKTRDAGLIEGTEAQILKMTYLDRNAKIEVGDLVISSGLGGIYPKGIPIGTIQMVGEEDPIGESKYAVVTPFAVFSQLEEVLCVLPSTEN